jgi:hypothetical protein
MTRSLSTTAKQAIFAQETSEVFLMLLTINHADLASPIYVANNTEDVVSNGNTFIGYPFTFEIPGEDAETLSQVNLVITNVDKLLVAGVRSIFTPLDVKLQVVLASDPDTIEAGDFDMKMRDVNYDALLLTGRCNFNDLLNEPYPAGNYTPADYPGLF